VLQPNSELTKFQVKKGYLVFEPKQGWTGTTEVEFQVREGDGWSEDVNSFTVEVVPAGQIIARQKEIEEQQDQIEDDKLKNLIAVKQDTVAKITIKGYDADASNRDKVYRLAALPANGKLILSEPKLTAKRATIIAAIFIIAYTMLAGLLSLAFTDIVTGTVITVSLVIAFPVLLWKAGGLSGMEAAYAAMGDRPTHMQFWGVYTPTKFINYCLPVFLLVLGDANQYQRIFASKNAKGAKTAVTVMIFLALAIELLIIASAWIAGSMIPDPENGRYVLIYAAKHFMPLPLGMLFLVTVVGIIISTADSFLLVPATTFIKDVYQVYINPKANEKHVVLLSRLLVLAFGVIAWLVSLAFAESTTVFKKALYAFTIYGAAITPCLVAALFWKKATKWGAITSIVSGTSGALAWEEIDFIKGSLPASLSDLDAVLPAITISVAALFIVSLLTQDTATPIKD
jgi:Na+/proline symporter